jgi:Tol biopolymer transport system component
MPIISQLLSLTLALTLQSGAPAKISKVCFSRGGFIYVKDMKSGIEKRIAKGTYPSISPDGSRVAYSVDGATRNGDMTREIRVVDLATGRVAEFESLKSYLCYGTVWSPDSTKIAFGLFKDNRWHAVVLDVKSGDWRILTEKVNTSIGVSSTTWGADSKSILTQDLDNVYQISLAGDLQRKFGVSEIVDDISYVSSSTTYLLANGGGAVVFDTDELPDDKRPPMIWHYDLTSKTRKRLSPKNLAAYHPVLLPSGDELVFTAVSLARRKSAPAIYRMRMDGTNLQLVVANAEDGTVAVEW